MKSELIIPALPFRLKNLKSKKQHKKYNHAKPSKNMSACTFDRFSDRVSIKEKKGRRIREMSVLV
jgi:hypothetical protein